MINRTFTRNFNTTYLNNLFGSEVSSRTKSSFLYIGCLLFCFYANINVGFSQACPSAPTISTMVFSPTDPCANENHSIINVTPSPASPGLGFEYRYSIDGGSFVANSLPGGVIPGPHCFSIAVFAESNVPCGGTSYSAGTMIPNTTRTYCLYFGTAPPNPIAASDIIGNLTCQTSISVTPNPNFPCFTYEYSVDGGGFTSTLPIAVSPGCHTLAYRLTCSATSAGSLGCAPGLPSPTSVATNFSIFDDLSKLTDASIIINRTCSSGSNGTVTSINGLPTPSTGLTYEYSFDGSGFSTILPSNLTPGCHSVIIRQIADCPESTGDGTTPAMCRKTLNFVVYPTPPVIAPTANTCNAMFTLPNVPAVGGFTVEYELDGSGTWSTAPSTTTPGCHSVRARYVLSANCGSAPFNIIPSGSFSDGASSACTAPSASVSIVIFPAAPVLTAPNNTCNAAFALPSVVPSTPPTGFTLQWSIDGGVFSPSPIIPTTPGCHNVRAQYALTADCGATLAGSLGSGACGISNQVNVVIFPTAPIITAPSNTCASAFILPVVTAITGFTIQYSIDAGAFAAAPVVPTTPGCHNVIARYVLAADCGVSPQNVISAGTAGSGACGNSNTVNVVIFPTEPTYADVPDPDDVCNMMFTLPAITNIPDGFSVYYSIDNGPWSIDPSVSSPGCHRVKVRFGLTNDCGVSPQNVIPAGSFGIGGCGETNNRFVVIYPLKPILNTPSNTCQGTAFTLPNVPNISGFTVQYSISKNGVILGGLTPWRTLSGWSANLIDDPGCYSIRARYVNTGDCGDTNPLTPFNSGAEGDCGPSDIVNVVVFPTAPIIIAPVNTCATMFTLPAVTDVDGFTVQYSINGGSSWTTNPSTSVPGCYTVLARYVLTSDCGGTLAGTSGTGGCGNSNTVYAVIFPDAPVITPPANTCAAPFTLPNVTLIDGYNVEWSIDGLPFTGSPVIPSTHGCHSIRARYVSANACGPIPSGSAGPAPCNQSNLVNVVIFPQIVATPGTVTRASQCGITDATFTWSGPAPTTTLSGVAPANGSFELRYDIDGGTAFTNTTGVFTNVAPGCHTIEARYVLTTTCGSTTAPAVAPAACGVSQTFVVWPLLSNTNIPILTLANNCGSAATISNVDISNAPSLPAGMQFVYFYYRNGGGLEGPVTLDVLKTIDFSYNALGAAPGCHKIDARINLSVACGSIPANDGLFSPGMSFCRTASINFLTFPTPPTLSVNTVCNGGNLVVTPTPLSAPANHIWAYRLINTTGTPIVGAWQSINTFVNPPTGCYRIEATPVRNINCDNPPPGLIDAPVLLPPNGLIFPTDIQMPLVNQNGGNPAVISAACTSSIDAFVLPAPPMAITPNNITVCLGDQGKIDLQYFEQMVPSCLVDPVTGFGPATISYIVTSSDPLVVAPGSYTNLLNNVPELMWMGQNGNNFPNVVTIGVTPRITLGGVSCDGAEVKFSITVQPNFTVTTPWVIDPNTASQCANNNGWTVSTTANTRVGCQYELYFNPSTSPLAAPIGNALVQMINGNGAPVSFQKFYIPGTYQVWERCNGCAELAATFNVQIIGAPVLTDILLETCPSNPGGNTGLFSGITYPTPAATVPPSVVTILGYYKTFTGAVNATPADLISSTGGFNYTSSDAVIYVRIGQNVDGLPGDDCFHIGRIELRVVNRPVVYLTANPNPTCTNTTVTITSNVSNTSGSTVTYEWARVSPVAGAIAATTSSITVTETTAGAYVYSVTVTDPNTGTNGANGPVCTTIQDITVNYTAPTITCPANFTVATDPGVCTAYQNLQPALVNSQCASNYIVRYYTTGVTVIGTSAAPVDLSVVVATAFNKDITTVNAVVGTLVSGVFTPVSPAVTCSYTVEVKDTEPPIAKCKNTTIFLNTSGMASITATDINSGSTDNCSITSTVANPTSFTCANVGMNAVTLTVTDMSSNTNTCTAMVQVIDNTAPTLVCPASVTMNVTPSIGCTWTAAALAPTTASDNCTPAPILTYSIINPDQTVRSGTGNVNGLIFDKGTSIVSYTLTDGSGNKSICTFTVTVLDNVVPVITNCPVDVTVEITTPTTVTITPSPSSTNGNYAATVDGCGVNLTYTPPTVSDNCPMSRIELTQGVGGTSHYYDAGTIHVERYVATDMSNNTASCQFTIKIVDKVVPTISCPKDFTIGTDPSTGCLAYAPVTPFASDNCGNTSIKYYFTSGIPAPSQFPNPSAIDPSTAINGIVSGAFYPATNGTSGSTIVTYIVTDASGNTAACSTTVTVQDDDVPQIVCPQSITLNANKDCQGVLGAPFTASATDNCSGMTVSYVITGATTVASTSGTAVPTSQLFNLGISFVTFTVTDANDNKATCTSTVTVKDVTAPTFDCPAAVTVNADANCIGTYAVVAPANQSDNCTASGNLTWSVVPTSGNALPLGTTYFVYTVTDLSGNTKTCSQSVTVRDITKPTIICPPNIAVGTDASNNCSANVPLTPAIFDNCTNTTVTTAYANGVPAPSALPTTNLGGIFSLGQTIVTFTVTDANNNSQTCSMTVTVTDDDAPIIMCPPSVTVGTGERTTCDAVLPSLNLMAASDNCTTLTTTNVQYSLSGATVLGNTNTTGVAPNFGVPSTQVYNNGLTVVTFTATDAAGNKTVCTSNVTVIDNTPPTTPICPADITVTITASGASVTSGVATIVSTGACGVTLSYPSPTSTDNCTPATNLIKIVSGIGFAPNFYQYGGSYTTVYKSVDNAGNESLTTCSTKVTILDAVPPVITCPVNTTVSTDPGVCEAKVTYGNPLSSDNCNGYTTELISGPASGAIFPLGTTTVQYKVTDPANNMTTCSFTVTVQDKEAPKVTCPSNVLVGMDAGVCYATRTDAQLRPTATDNCSTDAIMIPANTTHSISGALVKATTSGLVPATTQFPTGISYITYTVHDGAVPTTNSATCQFVVEVYDNQAPTLPNCPNGQTITVNTDGTMSPSNPIVAAGANYPAFNITPTTSPSNGCGIQISYPTPTALDNCAASSMTNTGGMGSGLHYYGVGTHTETWKATDANGNTVACSFTILVKDNELPLIQCPANVTVGTDPMMAATCSANVALAPVISDNCTNGTIKYYYTLGTATSIPTGGPSSAASAVTGSGSNRFFTGTDGVLGTTIVNYIVTDASGNTNTCSMTVSVKDDDVPFIMCPVPVTITANTDCKGVLTAPFAPVMVTDNCDATPTVNWSTSGATDGVTGTIQVPVTQLFDLGITYVSFTVTDDVGNSAKCTSTITVIDETAPTFTNCPQGTIVNVSITDANYTPTISYAGTGIVIPGFSATADINGGNYCGLNITYTAPSATDNCTNPVVANNVGGYGSGTHYMPVGTSLESWKVSDASGNLATCTFTINVLDRRNPSISCPANVTVGTDAANVCTAAVVTTPVISDNCNFDNATGINPPLKVTMTGATTNGGPVVATNTSAIYNLGVTTVTYIVTDFYSNTNSCSFTITVVDDDKPLITCPANITLDANAVCVANATALQLTPSVSDNCILTATTLLENTKYTSTGANVLTGTNVVPSSTNFNLGTTNIIYTVSDGSGNTRSCSFNVTVRDITPPVITCPVSITVTTNGGWVSPTSATAPYVLTPIVGNSCGIQINYPTPTATDNCSKNAVIMTNTGGMGSGDHYYGVGVHTETWKAVDTAGNSAVCTFNIVVRDTVAPSIVCPVDMTVNNDVDKCGANFTLPSPVVADNCTNVTYVRTGVLTPISGSFWPVSTTPYVVTYTATDASSNTKSCSFNVTVKDVQKPTVDCPIDMTVYAPADNSACGVIAMPNQMAGPFPKDNCGFTLTWSSVGSNPFAASCPTYGVGLTSTGLGSIAGTFIPVGLSTVTYLVTDASGNTNNCTFKITVLDTVKPIIVVNPLTITLGVDGCYTLTTGNVTTLTNGTRDACGIKRITVTPNTFNCGNVGDNIVKIVVEDNNCNIDSACGIVKVVPSAACNSTVTVSSSVCLNNSTNQENGQFRDTIVIRSPANRVWSVYANTGFMLDNSTNNPNNGMYMNGIFFPQTYNYYQVGDIVVEKKLLSCGIAEYRIVGRHTDAVGYSISFVSDSLIVKGTLIGTGNHNTCIADTTSVKVTNGTSNKAFYPNLAFKNWVDSWCKGSGILSLEDKVDTLNTKVGIGYWTVNGNLVQKSPNGKYEFNNSLYGEGYHKVCFTFDAGNYVGTSVSTSNTRDSVGCQTTICNTIQVGNVLSTLICNDKLYVSLDTTENCTALIDPDMILEGPEPCNANYQIIVKKANGEILDTNYITSDMIGQTLTVTVKNLLTNNSCWGVIVIEDKMAPIVYCPKDITVSCSTPLNDPLVSPTNIANLPRVKECSRFTLDYDDEVYNDGCNSPYSFRIKRTWTAVDTFDHVGSCEQWIYFVRDTFAYNTISVTTGFPLDAVVDCSSSFETVPSTDGFKHPSPNVTGAPRVKGKSIWPAGNNTCEINTTFTDVVIPVCAPAEYKIIRTWVVLDWCRGNKVWQHEQIIKVGNTKNPEYTPLTNLVIGTGYTCSASYKIPTVPTKPSGCSDNIRISKVKVIKANGVPLNSKVGNVVTLEFGVNVIQYTFENSCTYATTTYNHYVEVRDTTKPVPVCRSLTEVSLTNGVDNPLTSFKECGLTRVDAKSFDEGSWDNCNPVYFKVKRIQSPDVYDSNGNFDDYVYFNCEDVGKETEVILRVYDNEPVSGHVPSDTYVPNNPRGSHYNECVVKVNVKDLVNPTIVCPSVVNISCTAYDFSIPLTNADTSWFNKYFGRVVTQDCNGVNSGGSFTYFNGVNQVSGTNGYAFDNCFVNIPQTISSQIECGVGTITRTFRAVDNGGRQSTPCTQLILITNTSPFSINALHYTDPGSDLADPCDGTERLKANLGANEDFVNDLYVSPNFPADNIIWPDKVVELTNCTGIDSVGTECANTGKDAGRPRFLRNDKCDLVAMDYKDENYTIADPACKKILRTWTVIDWCQNKPLGRKWTYTQIIKIVNKVAPDFTGNTCKNDTICQYPTDCGPDPLTLCATAKDDCTPDAQLKYSYFIDIDNNGTNDLQGNGSCVTITKAEGLKYGRHMITWSVEDNCGNIRTCTKSFLVKDCKKPTPVGKLLSIELMPIQCRATLEAVKVNNNSWDNCTPMANIRLRLAKSGQYSPTMTLDQVLALDEYVIFDNTEVGTQTIALFAIDGDNNWDYVETFVVVQSNMDPNCIGSTASVTGTVKNEDGIEVGNVDVYVNSVMKQNTTASGFFNFLLNYNSNYKIEPKKDIEHRNGVSTADLVAINKHILAIQELKSPYRRIAADVNNDKKISTADMVELRKLILYTQDQFTKNTSWKIVDKNYVFTTDKPEGENYPLYKDLINLNSSAKADFIATKIGDVNNTAKPNEFVGETYERSGGTIVFDATDVKINSGEEKTIEFKSKDLGNISGYQFTMNFNKEALEYVGIEGLSEQNVGLSLLSNGAITFSNESVKEGQIFTVTFRAKRSVQLSESISIGSRYTVAEGYTLGGEKQDIALSFNGGQVGGFQLLQNQPNPFNGKTVIGFSLPEATNATMSIFDATGRTVKVIAGSYVKGYNEIVIDKAELKSIGLFSYRLTTDKHSATKQMIITE